MTLPRIDDQKRWAGYAGLAGTAKKIAKLIPNCRYYVEPFAGTAKVFQELLNSNTFCAQDYILNDTSVFVKDWLVENFADKGLNVRITMQDFIECIKTWDNPWTVFLIDGPWFKGNYQQGFSSFNRESVKAYDEEILKVCRNIRGKFIIVSRKENKIYLESEFNHKLVKSIYVVSGKYPKVLITTNLDLKK